ncbi:hypothetical protein [Vibrio chagasii]|uniref:hypothetical protein n=1 Tax=Vibrio chagasii TaxID=170679 RepID=UPI000152FE44|nr:hypothetical protein [Vibrio chagasii]EDK29934.1 hypothetical protein VSWAT3_06481 [Vibrionales bacterium SWAT-3]MCY9828870.1 hypothetical protein [Vibrio chagasii]
MYELTLILSLMMGGNTNTAELDVETQFQSLEQCNQQGAELAEELKSNDVTVLLVQCERD